MRLMVGGVFLSEGILKFVYPNQGVGRFTKHGLLAPELTADFIGGLRREPTLDLNARIICAEIDAEELTKAALVAWRAVQQAEAAILNASDRANEVGRRIARVPAQPLVVTPYSVGQKIGARSYTRGVAQVFVDDEVDRVVHELRWTHEAHEVRFDVARVTG